MLERQPRRSRLRALAPTVAVLAAAGGALAGCGVAAQPSAVTFVAQHRTADVRAQQALIHVEQIVRALPRPASRAQLRSLGLAARVARERINESRVGLPTYETAEEEVPIAESEAGTGSAELNYALAELVRYSRRPTRPTYQRYLAYWQRGRDKWDESVTQLWRLAHDSRPPLI